MAGLIRPRLRRGHGPRRRLIAGLALAPFVTVGRTLVAGWDAAAASWRTVVSKAVVRMEQGLNAICTRSASLLHPRELACWDKGPMPTREPVIWFGRASRRAPS